MKYHARIVEQDGTVLSHVSMEVREQGDFAKLVSAVCDKFRREYNDRELLAEEDGNDLLSINLSVE